MVVDEKIRTVRHHQGTLGTYWRLSGPGKPYVGVEAPLGCWEHRTFLKGMLGIATGIHRRPVEGRLIFWDRSRSWKICPFWASMNSLRALQDVHGMYIASFDGTTRAARALGRPIMIAGRSSVAAKAMLCHPRQSRHLGRRSLGLGVQADRAHASSFSVHLWGVVIKEKPHRRSLEDEPISAGVAHLSLFLCVDFRKIDWR